MRKLLIVALVLGALIAVQSIANAGPGDGLDDSESTGPVIVPGPIG